ncbi:hypothetical protein Tco_1137378 [Tanacetum coccineum]
MNYVSQTSLGVATIREFKMQDRFFKEYLKLVDTDASTFLFSNATLEWFVLRTKGFRAFSHQQLWRKTGHRLLGLPKERYTGFEVEVSSKRTTSSQRDHMYIQRRDTSRHCQKDMEWQDNANNSLIPFTLFVFFVPLNCLVIRCVILCRECNILTSGIRAEVREEGIIQLGEGHYEKNKDFMLESKGVSRHSREDYRAWVEFRNHSKLRWELRYELGVRKQWELRGEWKIR